MLEYSFSCPHCWQDQLKMVDPSIENQIFIEDCEICCNPLEFNIVINQNTVESFKVKEIGQ
tara:strand:- start:5 stop:187 length:183 start_codon:yes stop_codon:yes gene_type:complete